MTGAVSVCGTKSMGVLRTRVGADNGHVKAQIFVIALIARHIEASVVGVWRPVQSYTNLLHDLRLWHQKYVG